MTTFALFKKCILTQSYEIMQGEYRGKIDAEEKPVKTPVIKPPPTPVTSHEMSTEL
jgi:hypothetical protein